MNHLPEGGESLYEQNSGSGCTRPLGPAGKLIPVLFGFAPDSSFAVFVDLDMDQAGVAANRTVLDIHLASTARKIDRDDNLFAAGVTNIASLLIHRLSLLRSGWIFADRHKGHAQLMQGIC
jgi:hypothetical protein